jgi:hypothetical protein
MKTQLMRSRKVYRVDFYMMYYVRIRSRSVGSGINVQIPPEVSFGSKSKSVGSGMYVQISPEVSLGSNRSSAQ